MRSDHTHLLHIGDLFRFVSFRFVSFRFVSFHFVTFCHFLLKDPVLVASQKVSFAFALQQGRTAAFCHQTHYDGLVCRAMKQVRNKRGQRRDFAHIEELEMIEENLAVK